MRYYYYTIKELISKKLIDTKSIIYFYRYYIEYRKSIHVDNPISFSKFNLFPSFQGNYFNLTIKDQNIKIKCKKNIKQL